jgi:hypothetical protein
MSTVFGQLIDGHLQCLVCARDEGEPQSELGKNGLHAMAICWTCKRPIMMIAAIWYSEQGQWNERTPVEETKWQSE